MPTIGWSWCGGVSCSWTGTTSPGSGAGVGACPVPGLELPSPGSGGADLGAVPVAEMMDNLWITVSRHGTCFWDSRSCMCTRCEKSEKEGKAYVLC